MVAGHHYAFHATLTAKSHAGHEDDGELIMEHGGEDIRYDIGGQSQCYVNNGRRVVTSFNALYDATTMVHGHCCVILRFIAVARSTTALPYASIPAL